ncbi:MAG: UDP-glucose 4-epimerase GalE [Rheinheimera sp.]|jgi:UDP-glucose 4-epimerase|nr:UDP-glucose 4-epimerase GalE [Gammaproteobacteria bacterium]MDZ7901584.1 UDP-glucose 4-epimerase GalE [Rheinheimera sp.]
MSTILLTGGAGYIASHTAVVLQQAGFRVIALDNLVNSSEESLRRVAQITGQAVEFIKADIRDADALREVFNRFAIDAVVHFAGLKAVGESTQLPLKYYDYNVAGTVTLCQVMAECNVKQIVFSSSATVYGAAAEVPIHERAPRSATNPYGQSKLMIELILEDLVAADPSWRVAVLRYFNPVGAHESGLIGEDPNGIPNNLMPFISQVAVGKREQLQVFGSDYPTQDGTGVRDYIHVMDLANGHLQALRYLQKHHGIEAFNLGTGQGYSVLDMVKAFSETNDIAVPYQIVDRRPGDVAVCYADATKARQLLDWQTQYSLVDMVRDAWRWQRQNPEGYRQID